jgi:L-iditol 2-dehydrogenase
MGVDYVFECTGQPTVWEASVGYVRRGGTVILFGGCKPGTVVRFPAERLHYDELTLRGTFHFTPSDVRKAAALLGKKALEVDRLISGTYPLQDIADVFARLSRGKGIKYALVPD